MTVKELMNSLKDLNPYDEIFIVEDVGGLIENMYKVAAVGAFMNNKINDNISFIVKGYKVDCNKQPTLDVIDMDFYEDVMEINNNN